MNGLRLKTKLGGLISRLRVADEARVLLGEEGHSGSDFFVIVFYNRVQKGKKILDLPRVSFRADLSTEPAHEIGRIHQFLPRMKQSSTNAQGEEYGELCRRRTGVYRLAL